MGNNSWTHPPFFSRHLTLQNLRNINFLDFSMFDALDACLMVHGSWLEAHGSTKARGGSWLMARCLPGPGDPEAPGAGPEHGSCCLFDLYLFWSGSYRGPIGVL